MRVRVTPVNRQEGPVGQDAGSDGTVGKALDVLDMVAASEEVAVEGTAQCCRVPGR